MTRNTLISNFIEKMEKERIATGLTQVQMAQQLEMSVSGYKKLIAGEISRIDLYTAYRLCEFTGKWLFEFYGENVSSELTRAAANLRLLTRQQLQFVSSVINLEIDLIKNSTIPDKDDYINLLTPTGSLQDGMYWDSVHIEKINVAHYRERFGADLHCALNITSTHLYPAYNPGDILLLSLSAPKDGDTGIFINKADNRGYIRKLRQSNQWILEPINNYGIPFIIDPFRPKDIDNWIVFGRVLTKMRVIE